MKPYGFEAKEYLRKLAIGKLVKVEVEFEKKIVKEEQNINQSMTFANVVIKEDDKEKCVQEMILKSGLA